ncbi:MAG: LapA family protein [Gammaproteobacteria bacterium]|mgnify:CR=1 FL=1|nr:LapA family protein [Gammaproteobacteria bacterium]MCP5425098.1 LapA family protein [Gammaproteobacteria bacterium]
MLWIKSFFVLVVALAVLVCGVVIFMANSQVVAINYVLGTTESPLSIVIVWAFTAGVALAVLIGCFVVLALRWRMARLRSTVDNQNQEIGILRKKSGQDVR